MGKGVSLSPSETPRGNHVVRVNLLPVDIRTMSAVRAHVWKPAASSVIDTAIGSDVRGWIAKVYAIENVVRVAGVVLREVRVHGLVLITWAWKVVRETTRRRQLSAD